MKELEKEFMGRGEMRDFSFKQLNKTPKGYIYEVKYLNEDVQYEVFKRKVNKRYNTVTYPQSASFGIYAWTYFDYEDALKRLNSL